MRVIISALLSAAVVGLFVGPSRPCIHRMDLELKIERKFGESDVVAVLMVRNSSSAEMRVTDVAYRGCSCSASDRLDDTLIGKVVKRGGVGRESVLSQVGIGAESQVSVLVSATCSACGRP